MKQKKIAVLMVEPGKEPVRTELTNTLEALQEAVSIDAPERGLIELIGIAPGILLLCNEEGKLLDLEPNRRVGDDIITGVFYVVSEDGEGNLASLSEEDFRFYEQRFHEAEFISEDELAAIPLMRFFC